MKERHSKTDKVLMKKMSSTKVVMGDIQDLGIARDTVGLGAELAEEENQVGILAM